MRTKIVAGNWKMNNTIEETTTLIKELQIALKDVSLENTRVLVAPTFVNLSRGVENAKDSNIEVVAQNMHQAKKWCLYR